MLLLKVLPWILGNPTETCTPFKDRHQRPHWNHIHSFFLKPEPGENASLLLSSPWHICPSLSSQGPPVRTTGACSLCYHRPSSLSTNARIRFEKGSSFCIQWTAGTFQITAEFKVSTKAASMCFLFVSSFPLISFSIRPKWIVYTSIHTIS